MTCFLGQNAKTAAKAAVFATRKEERKNEKEERKIIYNHYVPIS